jgi:hypothetical protein
VNTAAVVLESALYHARGGRPFIQPAATKPIVRQQARADSARRDSVRRDSVRRSGARPGEIRPGAARGAEVADPHRIVPVARPARATEVAATTTRSLPSQTGLRWRSPTPRRSPPGCHPEGATRRTGPVNGARRD